MPPSKPGRTDDRMERHARSSPLPIDFGQEPGGYGGNKAEERCCLTLRRILVGRRARLAEAGFAAGAERYIEVAHSRDNAWPVGLGTDEGFEAVQQPRLELVPRGAAFLGQHDA